MFPQHDDKYGHHERCSTSNLTNAYCRAHFVLLGKTNVGLCKNWRWSGVMLKLQEIMLRD
jgi:hypothetical protein